MFKFAKDTHGFGNVIKEILSERDITPVSYEKGLFIHLKTLQSCHTKMPYSFIGNYY